MIRYITKKTENDSITTSSISIWGLISTPMKLFIPMKEAIRERKTAMKRSVDISLKAAILNCFVFFTLFRIPLINTKFLA